MAANHDSVYYTIDGNKAVCASRASTNGFPDRFTTREKGQTMTKHYYAFRHEYGIGTVDEDGEWIGTVHVFSSKRDRDDYVDSEKWDGSYHREAITSKQARHYMLRDWYVSGHVMRHRNYDSPSEVPTSELADFMMLLDKQDRELSEW